MFPMHRLYDSLLQFVQEKEKAVLGKAVVAQRSEDGLFYQVRTCLEAGCRILILVAGCRIGTDGDLSPLFNRL
jgi:hypothetical protein